MQVQQQRFPTFKSVGTLPDGYQKATPLPCVNPKVNPNTSQVQTRIFQATTGHGQTEHCTDHGQTRQQIDRRQTKQLAIHRIISSQRPVAMAA